MPRTIDADAMLEYLEKHHCDDWLLNQYNADWIASWIESQPTIETAPQLIPVTERLPIQGEEVFAWAAPFVSKAWRNEKGDWVTTHGPAASLKPVTHWMPMPEPPKADE